MKGLKHATYGILFPNENKKNVLQSLITQNFCLSPGFTVDEDSREGPHADSYTVSAPLPPGLGAAADQFGENGLD